MIMMAFHHIVMSGAIVAIKKDAHIVVIKVFYHHILNQNNPEFYKQKTPALIYKNVYKCWGP